MPLPTSLTVRFVAVAITLLLAACSDSGNEPNVRVPARIDVTAGNNQAATVGTMLPDAVVVRVADAAGRPVPNHPIEFRVVDGGGSVLTGSTRTDATGMAQERWTLGTSVSVQRLEVRVTDPRTAEPLVVAEVGANARPDSPAHVTSLAGADQAIPTGSATPVRPSVRVTDRYGNPVGGATVTFAVTGGDGSISGEIQTTDAEGIATVGSWTLGPLAGPNSISATVTGAPPATFAAMATARPAATISKVVGDDQRAVAGAFVPVRPAVRVTDAIGVAVANTAVTWMVTSGGGVATGTSTTTGADGVATVGSWRLGGTVGSQTLTATVAGLQPAVFMAVGETGPSAHSVIAVQDNPASAVVATLVRPAVLVRDAAGAPMAGVSVTFSLGSSPTPFSGKPGAALADSVVISDAQGIARVGEWRLGSRTGSHELIATAQGLTPLTLTVNAVADAPALLLRSIASSLQCTVDFVARGCLGEQIIDVVDQWSNRVPGTSVSWGLAFGPARDAVPTSYSTVVTNSSGRASLGTFVAGCDFGAYTLIVSAADVRMTYYMDVFRAGPPASITRVQGDGQTAPAGSALPIALAVRVIDQCGHPSDGRSVSFGPAFGSSHETVMSGTDGVARRTTPWVLAPAVGVQYLLAWPDDWVGRRAGAPRPETLFTALATAPEG